MNNEAKLTLMRERYKKLENSNKNIKCPGVKNKLARRIRNMSKGE